MRRANGLICRARSAPATSLPVPDFSRDQHRGIARRDLLRELDDVRHRVIAIDEIAVIVGDRGKHGGDQFRIGRQRDVFLGAAMDRPRPRRERRSRFRRRPPAP